MSNRKYRDPVNFISTAKPIFAANTIPAAQDGTYGYERRWIIVPFDVRFPKNDAYRNKVLRAVDDTERNGIIYLAMQALKRLMDRGDFLVPESFGAVQQEFREVNADGTAWAREMLILDPAGDERGEDMWRKYRDTWADRKPAISRQEFYNQLEALPGVSKYQDRKRATKFRGVRLDPAQLPAETGVAFPANWN